MIRVRDEQMADIGEVHFNEEVEDIVVALTRADVVGLPYGNELRSQVKHGLCVCSEYSLHCQEDRARLVEAFALCHFEYDRYLDLTWVQMILDDEEDEERRGRRLLDMMREVSQLRGSP